MHIYTQNIRLSYFLPMGGENKMSESQLYLHIPCINWWERHHTPELLAYQTMLTFWDRFKWLQLICIKTLAAAFSMLQKQIVSVVFFCSLGPKSLHDQNRSAGNTGDMLPSQNSDIRTMWLRSRCDRALTCMRKHCPVNTDLLIISVAAASDKIQNLVCVCVCVFSVLYRCSV